MWRLMWLAGNQLQMSARQAEVEASMCLDQRKEGFGAVSINNGRETCGK